MPTASTAAAPKPANLVLVLTDDLEPSLLKYMPTVRSMQKAGSNVPAGWDEWDVAGNGYPELGCTMNENGREVKYGKRLQAYLTDVVSTKGQNFILNASAAGRPFALESATFAPHAPYTPAPRNTQKDKSLKAPRSAAFNEASMADKPAWIKDRAKLTKPQITKLDTVYRKRARSVRSVDLMLSRLRSTVRATGQLNNTYVMLSSDNGYHLGEHRLPAGRQADGVPDRRRRAAGADETGRQARDDRS